MQWIRCASAAVAMVAAGSLPVMANPGGAPDEVWTGRVTSATSRWARGGTAIVTESVLSAGDGRQISLRQLGGSVDGIGMIVLHAPPVLQAGDQVTAQVDVMTGGARSVRALYAVAPKSGPGGSAAEGGVMPFVRTEATESRAQLAWDSGCAIIKYHEAGTTHIDGDTEFTVMDRSLAAWRDLTQECSYFELRRQGTSDSEVGFDGVNMVRFREGRWCRPAVGEDPEECYDPDAAGLTTLFFIDDEQSERNGTILDADIELNAVQFSISVDGESNGTAGCKSDLGNTFTHEVGHLIGLDHTCWSGGIRLQDDRGDPVPSCGLDPSLPDEIREATMYNYQECGETKKSTPEQDDVQGVCSIYPRAEDPGECRAAIVDDQGCCASASVSGGRRRDGNAAGLVTLLGAALLLLMRRSRRRGT